MVAPHKWCSCFRLLPPFSFCLPTFSFLAILNMVPETEALLCVDGNEKTMAAHGVSMLQCNCSFRFISISSSSLLFSSLSSQGLQLTPDCRFWRQAQIVRLCPRLYCEANLCRRVVQWVRICFLLGNEMIARIANHQHLPTGVREERVILF